jgi:HEAT repeat protein
MSCGRRALFREMLAVGDLRSDGLASEVAALVLARPELLVDLVAVLSDAHPATRGHAADALERVSRESPRQVARYLARLLTVARADEVAMVRWHLAMILTKVTRSAATARRTAPALLALLDDPSAFVRAWAVSGLCLIGRQFDDLADEILPALRRLESDRSIAVRRRAAAAVGLFIDPDRPVPRSWVKVSSTAVSARHG